MSSTHNRNPKLKVSGQTWGLGRWILAVTSIIFSLLIGEIICRWITPNNSTLRFQQDVRELKQLGLNDFSKIVENDDELFWRLSPNRRLPDDSWPFRGIISNSQSLREDHEVPLVKGGSEKRILFIGDSCTFGYGLLHNEGFVQGVEDRLRARFPDDSVEAINAGVPGYSIFQGWRFLELQGAKYHPDLVVADFGWNDGSLWDGTSDLDHYTELHSAQPMGPLRRSALLQLIWRAVFGLNSSEPFTPNRPRINQQEFLDLLTKLNESANRHGAKLLLIVWPFRWNVQHQDKEYIRSPYQEAQYSFRKKEPGIGRNGSPGVVDLVPTAEQLMIGKDISEIFLDGGHATAFANQKFAEAIAEQVIPYIFAASQSPNKSPQR